MVRRALALLFLFAIPLSAAEVLTNDDIVKLVKAGLSPQTIEVKIETSATSFDTSTDALVALAKEGVPDVIIRAMVARGTKPAPPAAKPAPPAPPAAKPAKSTGIVRRYEVAVHRSKFAKCDTGELRVDGKGVKATHCGKGIDFDVAWSEITTVCHDYGFRGTIVFKTAKGEYRVSTTTPAEAKKIVEGIRDVRPSLEQREGCD